MCDAVSRGVDGFAEDVGAKGGASVALGTVVVVKVTVDQRRVGKRKTRERERERRRSRRRRRGRGRENKWESGGNKVSSNV